MPYINKETVKEFRIELKNLLPEFKISVTRRDLMVVFVKILSGPDIFTEKEKTKLLNNNVIDINPYWYKRHFEHNQQLVKLIDTILGVINKYNKTEQEDSDYGNIPSYYVDVKIVNYKIK